MSLSPMMTPGSINPLDLPLRIILLGWLLRRITPCRATPGEISTVTPELMYIMEYKAIKSITEDRAEPKTRFQSLLVRQIDKYLQSRKEIVQLLPNVTIVTVPRSKE